MRKDYACGASPDRRLLRALAYVEGHCTAVESDRSGQRRIDRLSQ
ncbi:hypothetical protein RFM99_11795 [Mesorhizobium sp. VK4C]|nr:hypothetical protein [Mesorhizobium sp. VK4C]MDX8499099.1 hypothetical protein [Mesorhizobium sp. VK4C]